MKWIEFFCDVAMIAKVLAYSNDVDDDDEIFPLLER